MSASAPWEVFKLPRAPTAENVARAMRHSAAKHRTNIQLRNVPRSALPADLRRLARQERLENISDVQIEYHRFLPTGRAMLSLSHPRFLENVLWKLSNCTMTALPILSAHAPPPAPLPRSRGAEGRAEAAERGFFSGNGPGGGIAADAMDVVMWGLPGKLTQSALRSYLTSVKLVGEDLSGEPECEVTKLDLPSNSFSLYSRHLVRLNSVSEAHRLVRRMHMTYFQQESWGKRYLIRARVVY